MLCLCFMKTVLLIGVKNCIWGGCWGVLGWILEILGECNSVMNRVMVGSVCTVFTDFR